MAVEKSFIFVEYGDLIKTFITPLNMYQAKMPMRDCFFGFSLFLPPPE